MRLHQRLLLLALSLVAFTGTAFAKEVSPVAGGYPGRPGGKVKKAGAPALTTSVEASPGGRLLLAQRIERTFSYLVQYSSFPRRIDVLREVGTGSAQAVTGG